MVFEDYWYWNSEAKLGLEVKIPKLFHSDQKVKTYNTKEKRKN